MEYSRTSLIVLISIQLVCIDAFSRGAPYFQCAEMRPSHGNQSESLDKFIINVYTDVISPGSQIEVNISSTDPSVLIMGVLVQAKSRVQNKYVGSFVVMPKTTKSVCVGNTGITHRQRLLVPNLNLIWNAPANLAENDHITFNATIVQNHRVYWQGVESRPVQVSTASPVVRIPDSTQSTRDWQPIEGNRFPPNPQCGVSVGCFHDCENGHCTFSVTWKHNMNSRVEFEMEAKTNGQPQRWISVGFSKDTKMGEDVVFECVADGEGVRVHLSFNEGKSNKRQPDESRQLSDIEGGYVDGILRCSFSSQNVRSDLDLNSDYFLMFADGEAMGDAILPHSFDVLPTVSNSKISLRSVNTFGGDKPKFLYVKVHGVLMMIGWLFLTSIGIVISRYGKPLWPTITPLGIQMWFHIHRTAMTITLLLTIISLLFILIEAQGLSQIQDQPGKGYRKLHPVFGFIIIIFTIANPIMALFRPKGDAPRRYIFNWCHRCVGITAFIMAVIDIFIGLDLSKSGAPKSIFPFIIIYIIYHVIYVIIMEILPFLLKKRREQKNTYNVQYMPKENVNTTDSVQHKQLTEDIPKKKEDETRYRMILLAFHTIFVSVVLVIVVLLFLFG